MTRTVGSIFGRRPDPSTIEGHPMVVGTGRVGIEIELEGIRESRGFRSPYWTVKGDGSLRNNGLEFVFSGPFGGVDLHNATLALDSFLFDKNPDGSRRCSTHVHVDVREMTVPQLRRYALGYLVYEKFLFRMSGIHRYNNNFCPAIGFAQHQLEVLGQAFRHTNDTECVNHIVGNWDKYSAMNFLPISQFGSVEFRISEAKWRKGLLIRLCNRFLSLKELAKSWTGTEREFVDYLASAEPRDIMGQGLPKKLPREYHEDLQIGHKLAHDLLSFADHPRIPAATRSLEEMLRDAGGDRLRTSFGGSPVSSGATRARARPSGWSTLTWVVDGATTLHMNAANWHRVCAFATQARIILPYEVQRDFTCTALARLMSRVLGAEVDVTEYAHTILDGEDLSNFLMWCNAADVEEDPFL